jgi:hypothetical protein
MENKRRALEYCDCVIVRYFAAIAERLRKVERTQYFRIMHVASRSISIAFRFASSCIPLRIELHFASHCIALCFAQLRGAFGTALHSTSHCNTHRNAFA